MTGIYTVLLHYCCLYVLNDYRERHS